MRDESPDDALIARHRREIFPLLHAALAVRRCVGLPPAHGARRRRRGRGRLRLRQPCRASRPRCRRAPLPGRVPQSLRACPRPHPGRRPRHSASRPRPAPSSSCATTAPASTTCGRRPTSASTGSSSGSTATRCHVFLGFEVVAGAGLAGAGPADRPRRRRRRPCGAATSSRRAYARSGRGALRRARSSRRPSHPSGPWTRPWPRRSTERSVPAQRPRPRRGRPPVAILALRDHGGAGLVAALARLREAAGSAALTSRRRRGSRTRSLLWRRAVGSLAGCDRGLARGGRRRERRRGRRHEPGASRPSMPGRWAPPLGCGCTLAGYTDAATWRVRRAGSRRCWRSRPAISLPRATRTRSSSRGSSSTAVRAASGWNEWQGRRYVSREAWEELLDAVVARDRLLAVAPDAVIRAAARRLEGRMAAAGYEVPDRQTGSRHIGWRIAAAWIPHERSARRRRSASVTSSRDVTTCRRCPRLVAWREEVARMKVARFRDDVYWGRPVPGFGDRDARVLLVGLAPAAHGGNRTGRVFTGDNPGGSGELLFAALHRAGFSPRPRSTSAARRARPRPGPTSPRSTAAPRQPTARRPPSAMPACPTSFASCGS